jgi:hypothetical protein
MRSTLLTTQQLLLVGIFIVVVVPILLQPSVRSSPAALFNSNNRSSRLNLRQKRES